MGNPNNILIAGRAKVWLAQPGTLAPADEVIVPTGTWRDVGLTTPDSLTVTENPTMASVSSHQSDFPTRRFQTGDEATLAVDLQEFSGPNLQDAWGGGTLDLVSPGHFMFTPPLVGDRGNISALADAIDGSKHYRWVVPLCQQNVGVTAKMVKTAETTLPLSLAVIGQDGVPSMYLLSDDPSFNPA